MPGPQSSKAAQLSIGEASRLLGVSETTLRQWTDEGKVRAFVTPGGHRRYREADLRTLMRGQHRGYRLKDVAARIEGAAVRDREIAGQYFQQGVWCEKLDESCRQRMRERGQQLLRLVVQYVSHPQLQEEALRSARELGGEYGADLGRIGVPLTDALEAFIMHRTPVLEAVTELMKHKEPLQRRALTVIDHMTHIIDQTLLALVEAHQRHFRPSLAAIED